MFLFSKFWIAFFLFGKRLRSTSTTAFFLVNCRLRFSLRPFSGLFGPFLSIFFSFGAVFPIFSFLFCLSVFFLLILHFVLGPGSIKCGFAFILNFIPAVDICRSKTWIVLKSWFSPCFAILVFFFGGFRWPFMLTTQDKHFLCCQRVARL